jgi:hypothetical protein
MDCTSLKIWPIDIRAGSRDGADPFEWAEACPFELVNQYEITLTAP